MNFANYEEPDASKERRTNSDAIRVFPYKNGFFSQANQIIYFFRPVDSFCWRILTTGEDEKKKYNIAQVDYDTSYIVGGEGIPADDVDRKIRKLLKIYL